jgi:hypothetical protein
MLAAAARNETLFGRVVYARSCEVDLLYVRLALCDIVMYILPYRAYCFLFDPKSIYFTNTLQ